MGSKTNVFKFSLSFFGLLSFSYQFVVIEKFLSVGDEFSLREGVLLNTPNRCYKRRIFSLGKMNQFKINIKFIPSIDQNRPGELTHSIRFKVGNGLPGRERRYK